MADYTTTMKLKAARLAGFKKRKPKTVSQMKAYISKYKEWEKEMSKYAAKGKEIQKLKDYISKI
mgnify:CR=1 FL=1